MSQVKRVDIENLFVLDNLSYNKSSDNEVQKIKKHMKKINTFIVSEYKYGGGSNCIEIFFIKKRIQRLNKLLEKYNVCICVCLSNRING